MLEEKLIDIGELRGACKALNATGLLETKLKVVGTKKITLAELFAANIEKMAADGNEEKIPKESKDYYNVLFADEFVGGEEDPAKEDPLKEDPPKKDPPKSDKPKPDKKKDKPKTKTVETSVFGHRMNTMASALDDAFAKGASLEQAADAAGCKVPRAKDHLAHLKRDIGCKVSEPKEGVFKAVK